MRWLSEVQRFALSSPLKPQPSRLQGSFVLHPLIDFDDDAAVDSATTNESRMVLNPNQCEIENLVEIPKQWIFRTSTAVSPQCLPQFSAEWNIASSSNPFQNCFLWRGQMCVRGRFQRHTRKIDFAQIKSDCGLSAGIRLWGPVMDFYRPFVVGWQDRVANFLENVQRQNRGVLNTVEQCWTLLRHCALDV